MAEMSYIFGDATTGLIIEEIRLQGVSFKNSFDGGEFRAAFYLDQSGKDNDTLISATEPGRTFVVVERDGVVLGDYIVWTRTYQSQAKVMQIYGIPYKDYVNTRLVDVDITYYDVEQLALLINLYQAMQADPNSIKVQLPSAASVPSTVLKTVEVWADDLKTYGSVIDSIANATDGFDWDIQTSRTADGKGYLRQLIYGYPHLGAAADAGDPVFSYIDTPNGQGGNILNYWCNDSMGSAATNFFGIGADDLTSKYVHTDLLNSGFPRYDAIIERTDVTDQGNLNTSVAQQANLLKAPLSVLTAEVHAEADPEFGTYSKGDACKIEIIDARFPNGLTRNTRIYGWEYYPPDDENVEYVRLTFEGEQYDNS